MNKGSFAKEQLMEDYLSALLTDEPQATPVTAVDSVDSVASLEQQKVARLLETATQEALQKKIAEPVIEPQGEITETKENQLEVETEATESKLKTAEQTLPKGEFQALFFNVAGLTLALPLTELGGIHKIEKVGPLFGKPAWFKGVMLHRDENLNVVDTAKWVMPEKYNEKLAESLNYQYLIMLDTSGWGLACESLVTTATLQPSDVKWREAHGKRPWLAGMVKEKMCALINVQQLVMLLDKGLGSNGK
jgi:purine-binding chemotaxis protein CheW